MTLNELLDLLDPALFLVIAACWVLGFILKQTPQIPNWSIVFILLPVAILFAIWILGFGPEVILQGILCAALASYGYDIFNQFLTGIGKKEQ